MAIWSTRRFDDAVVGAGVVGLAVAYALAQRGRKVVVFERRPRPQGASIRNFGMLWPIGQPAGPMRSLALRSRAIWLDVLAKAGAWHEKAGSLHLAYADDEAEVLREFSRRCSGSTSASWDASLHRRLAAGRPNHLRLGIHVMVAQNGLGEPRRDRSASRRCTWRGGSASRWWAASIPIWPRTPGCSAGLPASAV